MPTATIKLFLTQADPKRLRTAEISNWSGKAVAGPRTELDMILGRQEAENSGVYFLTGTDPDSGRDAIYIGEAEVLRDRIRNHLERDFWNALIFVISKDENLTKAHIKYLEGRLIERAKEAGRAFVVNGQSSGSRLPESDREDMEIFLDRIQQLMPILGADFLVRVAQPQKDSNKNPMLVCEIRGILARGIRTSEGFIVFKGSQAVLSERPSTEQFPYARTLRQRLIQEGVLEQREKWFEFIRDKEFTSPSAAAAVIQGGSANGLISWRTAEGKTLKELEGG